VAFTFLGLTVGDDGTGFKMPTYAAWRGAISQKLRQLRAITNLNTEPGSLYGDMVDLVVTGVYLAGQAASEAVGRTVYTAMGGVALDQFLANIITRVVATPSTGRVYAYGTAGAVVPITTPVRTSAVGVAFVTTGAIVVPAAPTVAYAVEIKDFIAGAYVGQVFTVTVAGTPIAYIAGAFDDAEAVRDGLLANINASLGLTQEAYRGGQSPTTARWCLIVIEANGGGPWAIAVAGPVGQIFSYPAGLGGVTSAPTTGPVSAPAESLRIGPPFAGLQGYVNINDVSLGRSRETDSQLKARFQVAQRGLGGGSPDAIRAIILSPIDLNGGGATYCAVEYNPGDENPDDAGNLPHSVRVVVDQEADGQSVANALWRAKAAGDNTNGPEAYVVVDAMGGNQNVLIDRLDDVWFAVVITVTIGTDWPPVGAPIDQLRQDVADYIEALQPAGNNTGGVRVNLLPISTFPNGETRGVINFTVQIGQGPQGGPIVYQDIYPTVEPNADLASIILTSRDKPRCSVVDVTASIVP
jgi:hypothetical protein